jgi:hypothetical protein
MATVPQIEASRAEIIEDAATKLARILEEHFDERGWSEEERDRRVAAASASIAGRAKSA